MTIQCVAIISPGDMGHAVGRALGEHGRNVITCLAGRGEGSRQRAKAANMRDAGSLEAMVSQADLVLSIMPPESAAEAAAQVAAAMQATGKKPPYADCNAISPDTAHRVGKPLTDVGSLFIDAGIIGPAPGRGEPPRFYTSGPDVSPLMALHGQGIDVRPIGDAIGRASGMKMVYAALTKGTTTLHTAVLLAAASLGLSDELHGELKSSQQGAWAAMQKSVPFLPADSGRWIGEMEEIAATFAAAGVTPHYHQGAAAIHRLLVKTPYANETRATLDRSRTVEQAVATYRKFLPMPKS